METNVTFLKDGKVLVVYDSVQDYGVNADLLEACELMISNFSPTVDSREEIKQDEIIAKVKQTIKKAKGE